MVFIGIVVIILIVYSSYQIVGLYYSKIFGEEEGNNSNASFDKNNNKNCIN